MEAETTYNLRVQRPVKSLFMGKFSAPLDFSKLEAPVRLQKKFTEDQPEAVKEKKHFKAARSAMDDFEEIRDPERIEKMAPWVLVEGDGSHYFVGNLEETASKACYFSVEHREGEFKIQRVQSWYSFKPFKERRAISAEEIDRTARKREEELREKLDKQTKKVFKSYAEEEEEGQKAKKKPKAKKATKRSSEEEGNEFEETPSDDDEGTEERGGKEDLREEGSEEEEEEGADLFEVKEDTTLSAGGQAIKGLLSRLGTSPERAVEAAKRKRASEGSPTSSPDSKRARQDLGAPPPAPVELTSFEEELRRYLVSSEQQKVSLKLVMGKFVKEKLTATATREEKQAQSNLLTLALKKVADMDAGRGESFVVLKPEFRY